MELIEFGSDLASVVERVVNGQLAPAAVPTEAAFHDVWSELGIGNLDPLMMALTGGAVADRLAWVFLAGYQACLRRTFPGSIQGAGWASFVNTEDPSGTLPGTRLTEDGDDFRLTGWKTWVAGAAHVEWLFVSSRQGVAPFVLLQRSVEGAELDVGAPKAYLSELTQGRVEFRDVAVAATQLVGGERTFQVFRACESAYVRAALNAFMLSHCVRLGASHALIARAVGCVLATASLLSLPMPSTAAAIGLAGVDTLSSEVAASFRELIADRDPALFALWEKDRRLVDGAAQSIRARAEQALDSFRREE